MMWKIYVLLLLGATGSLTGSLIPKPDRPIFEGEAYLDGEVAEANNKDALQCIKGVCAPVSEVDQYAKEAKETVMFLSRVLDEIIFAKENVIGPLVQIYNDDKLIGGLVQSDALDEMQGKVANLLQATTTEKDNIEAWASKTLNLVKTCAEVTHDLTAIQKLRDFGAVDVGDDFQSVARSCILNDNTQDPVDLRNAGIEALEEALEYITSLKTSIDSILDEVQCYNTEAYTDAMTRVFGIAERDADAIVARTSGAENPTKGGRFICIGICLRFRIRFGRRKKRAIHFSPDKISDDSKHIEHQDYMTVKLAEYRQGDQFCATPREILALEYAQINACLMPFKHLLKDIFLPLNEELDTLNQGITVDLIPITLPTLPDASAVTEVVNAIRDSSAAGKADTILRHMTEDCRERFTDGMSTNDELKQCLDELLRQ